MRSTTPRRGTNQPTITQLTDDINAKFREIDVSQQKADQGLLEVHDKRIEAGHMLHDARERVTAMIANGEYDGTWNKWCAEKIDRSRTDIYRCLKLVEGHNSPTEALTRERTEARESMRATRARQATEATQRAIGGEPDPGLTGIRLARTLKEQIAKFAAIRWETISRNQRREIANMLEDLIAQIAEGA